MPEATLTVAPPSAPAEERLTPIGQALTILGDRWVLMILQRAFLLHVRTFAGWRDELGISESVLASRLKELVACGIFEMAAYRNGRMRYEYRLTQRGLDLWSLLVAVYSWERDWTDRELPPLIHDVCGHESRPVLGCGHCLNVMTARGTHTVRGPNATFASAHAPRQHRRTAGPRPDYLGYCPDAMEILGDRWSTHVLAAAFLGVKRFGDFQAEMGIAPSVLTDRLRRFVDLGVFRSCESGYRLTERGLAFFEVFAFLVAWAQRELPTPPGSTLDITHKSCGAGLAPVLLCTACGGVLARREVHFDISA
ncbi:winged helix-turn-helix transcriptional regulator [Herbidospora daliensis]|uniref:winged helix-turn-helix transcriptional regulator n=1 Tax=Herbidospora daliensis TaxID=295585 RepID=UPI000780422B|nr:helix-turn-helix domain-containing protein [Herbidospora daliensis]